MDSYLNSGKYSHLNGPLLFTDKTLNAYKNNWLSRVVEWDLSVNYNHDRQEAAGWIQDLDIRDDGLWALVLWTDNGLADLEARRYRYISSEIAQRFKHPKTGKRTKYVLLGAALTNIPHLMDITAIEMEVKMSDAEAQNLL